MFALRDKVAAFSKDLGCFTHELSDALGQLRRASRLRSDGTREFHFGPIIEAILYSPAQ